MSRVEIENNTHKIVKLYAVEEDITVQKAYSKLLKYALDNIKSIRRIDEF